jgi:hypothetical protein
MAITSNIYPNWDFWFENKPSGNHADEFGKKIAIIFDKT